MVWLALRADMRQRWRALLGLALLLGLVGGVVLTAAAGAQRTDTAYPRLLSWANATQFDITPKGTGLTGYYTALARLPRIAAFTTESLYQTSLPSDLRTVVESESSPDGALGIAVDKVKVLSGALYDPARPGEAMIDPRLASLEHLRPGGTLRLAGIPNGPDGSPDYGKAVPLAFTVTAIVVFDNQVVRTGTNAAEPTALLSSPFAATAAARSMTFGDEAAVRLAPGASQAAFVAAASQLAKRYTGTAQRPGTAGSVLDFSLADQVAATEQAIRPEAVALAAFAASPASSGSPCSGNCSAASSPSTRPGSRCCAPSARRAPPDGALAGQAGRGHRRGRRTRGRGGGRRVTADADRPARLAEPRRGSRLTSRYSAPGRSHRVAAARRAAPGRAAGRGRRGGGRGRGGRRSRPSRLAAALTGPALSPAESARGWRSSRGADGRRSRCAAPWPAASIAVAALMAAAVFGASLVPWSAPAPRTGRTGTRRWTWGSAACRSPWGRS